MRSPTISLMRWNSYVSRDGTKTIRSSDLYVSFVGGDKDYQTVATILVFASAFIRMSADLAYRKKTRRVGMVISLCVAIAAHALFLFATFTPEHFRRFRYFSPSGYSAESESSADDYDEPRDELDE